MYSHFPTDDRALPPSRSGLGRVLAAVLASFSLGTVPPAHALLPLPLNTPPILQLQASPLVVEATGPSGAVVTFEAGASDPGDLLPPLVTASPASGSTFPLGDTTVNVSALDLGGLLSLGRFTVHVRDTTAPIIELNGPVEVTVAMGADFNHDGAWASDAVDENVAPHVSGHLDLQAPGSYTLTYSATDFSGNSATPVTQTIHVVDPLAELPRGRYHGGNISGHGDATVAINGQVTAALFLEGHVYRAAFKLAQPAQTVLFRAASHRTLTAHIAIYVSKRGETSLSVHTPLAMLDLRPSLYSPARPAPASVAGAYTAVFRSEQSDPSFSSPPQPIGQGIATITVARHGTVRAVGHLADGTPFTSTACLVPVSEKPVEPRILTAAPPAQFYLHTGLYTLARRGNFGAVFTLDREAALGSLHGSFSWLAPKRALPLYPGGLRQFGEVAGSRYEKALPAAPLGLRFQFRDDSSYFAGGTVHLSPEGFELSSGADPSLRKFGAIGLRCRFVPATGLLAGTRTRATGPRTFKAVWLQEQNLLAGFCLGPDARSHGAVEGRADSTK